LISLFVALGVGACAKAPSVDPKVAECAGALAGSWRKSLATAALPTNAEARLAIYTAVPEITVQNAEQVYDQTADRATRIAKQAAAIVPGSHSSYFGSGSGVSSYAMGPAEAWRGATDAQFEKLCALGVQEKALLLELGLYQAGSPSPIFQNRWTSELMPKALERSAPTSRSGLNSL
jgi:hypothetical protein